MEHSSKVVLGAFKALLKDDLQLEKDYQVLAKRLKDEGIGLLTITLPKLGKVFDHCLGLGQYSTSFYPFKASRGCVTPRFLGSLYRRVFHHSGELRVDACPRAVGHIRQVLYLAYKLDIPSSPDKEEDVIKSFFENEEELKSSRFSDPCFVSSELEHNTLLALGNKITQAVFEKMGDFVPKHGPGKSSNVSIQDKYEGRLHAGSPAYQTFGHLFFFNDKDAFDRIQRHPVYRHENYFSSHELDAKVILVPKDSRGPRLISAEPFEHMYIQQGIARAMMRKLETFPLTKGIVNFSSNEENRALALEGSRTKVWSTIDLKDASDRVSLGLVVGLFSGTELLPQMLACRTRYTNVNGQRHFLEKFAPMGSALCFPVLSYVCFILSYTALVLDGVSPEIARSSIRVYGDDIIVRTEYAATVVAALEAHELKVNKDKSFINSDFCESCGTDAFRGEFVTPVRLKKVWNLKSEERQGVPSSCTYHLCALANNLPSAYSHLREYFFALAEKTLGEPLPYGLDLSYLCRVTSRENLPVFLSEMIDRNKKCWRKGKIRVWKVITKSIDRPETPYGRLQRTTRMLGMDLVLPEFGKYEIPRNSVLVRRAVKPPCAIYTR